MKKIFISALLALFYLTTAFSQTPTAFTGCPSVYVTGFKNGTNCTVAGFSIYRTDLSGNLSAQPLFTTNPPQEINGIGVSAVDGKGYAMMYDLNAACFYTNVKLLRFGANGATQVIGIIPAPVSDSSLNAVNAALGAIDVNGDYYFLAFTGSKVQLGKIANLASLNPGSTLSPVYTPLTVSCPATFADFAFSPTDGKLYTYGIYQNGNSAAGTLMQIDMTTNNVVCLGTPNTTEFTNATLDNFGGIMFGEDNMMYGTNVYNRKFYKINPVSGALTYISTVAGGSGQLRGDMGSCATITPPTPFTDCPAAYVVAFKNGFNCTADGYKVHTIDLLGNLSAAPLFTTPDSIEINSLGIARDDGKGYGMMFRRYAVGSGCAYDTVKLFRFGLNGSTQVIGAIPPPLNGTINTALGTIDASETYLFGANIGTQAYLGRIPNVQTLVPGGPIMVNYTPITIGCQALYSDWAVNPFNSKLYTYGIIPNGSASIGTVMVLDLNSNMITCIGTPNTTEFTNSSQDNFGGIMFGRDGNMYGINVATRKYYKINPSTGAVTYISAIPGGLSSTNQLRCDMASCVNNSTSVLPIGFSRFTAASAGACKALLTWEVSGTETGDLFEIEKSYDGINYTVMATQKAVANVSGYTLTDAKPGLVNYYRIKGLSKDGSIQYSSVVKFASDCGGKNQVVLFDNLLAPGSALSGQVSLYKTQNVLYNVYDASGAKVFSRSAVTSAGVSRFGLAAPLSKGVYLLQIVMGDEKSTQKFVVQ